MPPFPAEGASTCPRYSQRGHLPSPAAKGHLSPALSLPRDTCLPPPPTSRRGAPIPRPLPAPSRGRGLLIRKARRRAAPRRQKPVGGPVGARARPRPPRPLPARAPPDRHSPKHSTPSRTHACPHTRSRPRCLASTRARSASLLTFPHTPTRPRNTRDLTPTPQPTSSRTRSLPRRPRALTRPNTPGPLALSIPTSASSPLAPQTRVFAHPLHQHAPLTLGQTPPPSHPRRKHTRDPRTLTRQNTARSRELARPSRSLPLRRRACPRTRCPHTPRAPSREHARPPRPGRRARPPPAPPPRAPAAPRAPAGRRPRPARARPTLPSAARTLTRTWRARPPLGRAGAEPPLRSSSSPARPRPARPRQPSPAPTRSAPHAAAGTTRAPGTAVSPPQPECAARANGGARR